MTNVRRAVFARTHARIAGKRSMRCNAIILIIMHHYRVAISNNNNYYDPVSGITLLYIHNYFRNTVSIIVGPDLNDTITRSAQRYRIIRDYLANRHPSSPPPAVLPAPRRGETRRGRDRCGRIRNRAN
jgi:hypothetical protein